ncbi:unnamed protein product, partial [Medioppia subpectinata]
PIFYLHHSMIDRIWESWLNNGGEPVLNAQYLNTSFKFFDENGKLGTYYVRDYYNATRLHYKYDKLLELPEEIPETFNSNPKLYYSVNATEALYINSAQTSIILNIEPKYHKVYMDMAQGQVNDLQIRVDFAATVTETQTGLLYDLYLNLPQNTEPNEGLPNFIGQISHFGAVCVNRTSRQQPSHLNECTDITDNLIKVLRTEYNYYGDVKNYLNLTIVSKSCDTVVYPLDEEYTISFSQIFVVHYFPYKNQSQKDSQNKDLVQDQDKDLAKNKDQEQNDYHKQNHALSQDTTVHL